MPSTARRAQRRDRNEKDLVQLARSLGAHWNYLEAGQGADGVLVNKYGVMFYVEIKDPNKSPSERKLTDDENALRTEIDQRGGRYEVVETYSRMKAICREQNTGDTW